MMQGNSATAFGRPNEWKITQPQLISNGQLPGNHPVAQLNSVYGELMETVKANHLPSFDTIKSKGSQYINEYSLVLKPIPGEPYLDFSILHAGNRLPGVSPDESGSWKLYSETIKPEALDSRLLELASALAIRTQFISSALSARSSTLNMKVFRGLFPVYIEDTDCAAVILLVAPVYSEVANSQ